jgi:hypothetical protein
MMNYKCCGKKRWYPNLKLLSQNFWGGGAGQTTKIFIQDIRFLHCNLNPERSEYEGVFWVIATCDLVEIDRHYRRPFHGSGS